MRLTKKFKEQMRQRIVGACSHQLLGLYPEYDQARTIVEVTVVIKPWKSFRSLKICHQYQRK